MGADKSSRPTRNVVLFVSLSGWLAGPGRSLATIISHLPDHIEPVLACPDKGNLLPAVRERTPRVRYMRLPRRPGQKSDPWSRLKAVVVLCAWMMRYRRRILAVHANGFSDLHIAAPGLLLTRRPVVVWFHGHERNPWDRRLGWLWRLVLPNRQLAAVAEVARIRAVEGGIADRDDIEIIPNPIDPKDVVAQLPEPHRNPHPVVIAYMGGERQRKGFFALPDLIARLSDSPVEWAIFDRRTGHEDVQEEIIWGRLEAAGSDRVKILGRLDDVRQAYASCDIVVSLSNAEAHPRGVIEPMLNGIPVVVSKIPAHEALIGENEGGLLFPLGDLDAAAEAIRRLASDDQLRERLGKRAKMLVEGPTNPNLVVGKFVAIYERLGSRT